MTARSVIVVGAGILGVWQALTLARAGHRVRLIEASARPFDSSASIYAGAMLAPYCEGEAAPPVVRDQGRAGLQLWRESFPHLINAGSLVVAGARDLGELKRFERLTEGHELIDEARLASLEPDLSGRFGAALFFADEAHMATPAALEFLLGEARRGGAEVTLGARWSEDDATENAVVVDCRGLAARPLLPSLRGVRGERLLIRSHDIRLARPVRLLHPRHPIYVVPWSDGRYVVGATVLESEDDGPASVRSALELLGAAYALHPGFGEAEILDVGAGVRPAFPDNVPRAIIRDGGRHILVNGAYRHGFLLAPVLAKAVADYLATGSTDSPLVVQE